jgi:hypothetical protein
VSLKHVAFLGWPPREGLKDGEIEGCMADTLTGMQSALAVGREYVLHVSTAVSLFERYF